MWIPSFTLLGFLGVSVSPCAVAPEICEVHPPSAPEIRLIRSPFKVSIAPADPRIRGADRCLESMTVIFPAGAGHDPLGGGFHARVATRVMADLLSRHVSDPLTTGCVASVGGSSGIIQLRYPQASRRSVLQQLRQLISGVIPLENIASALHAERSRPADLLCPCFGETVCTPLQQAIHQGIEAFDPLPAGATRSGNRLRLHRVSVESCRRWLLNYWNSAWVHLECCCDEVHRRNRRSILSDITVGLGKPTPTDTADHRPLLQPIPLAIFPATEPSGEEKRWTLVELSARTYPSVISRPVFGEERIGLRSMSFPAAEPHESALVKLNAHRLSSLKKIQDQACEGSPNLSRGVFDRYAESLQIHLNWQEPHVSRRLVLYIGNTLIFCSWQ